MFNFNSLSEQNFASNASQYLRPYEIYKVNLTKIEKTEIKGSKDPNKVYPVVSLEFTSTEDKGAFSTNLFIPDTDSEDDMDRPTYKNNEGHEYKRPSRFENFQFTLMQIVHAINPVGEEKIKAVASKIKTIDQFINLVIKELNDKNNVETNLKLVGRNNNGKVYATLPNACGLNKSNELFPVNFIGDNLLFTAYELQQQKLLQSATPTKMESVNEEKSDDTDLDDLEL